MSDTYADADTPWRDEETLRELHFEEGMTQQEIADELGCTSATVSRWFQQHNIETQTTRSYDRYVDANTPWRDEETLRELHWDRGMSLSEVADHLDTDHPTIKRWLKKHDIPIHDSSYAWNGKLKLNKNGYEVVRTGDGVVRLHRLLAIAEYGFDAVVDNDVHHENSIPWDNRQENISVVSRQQHMEHHGDEFADGDGRWRDPDFMQMMWDKHGTASAIARELPCSRWTVRRWLDKHDIGHITCST